MKAANPPAGEKSERPWDREKFGSTRRSVLAARSIVQSASSRVKSRPAPSGSQAGSVSSAGAATAAAARVVPVPSAFITRDIVIPVRVGREGDPRPIGRPAGIFVVPGVVRELPDAVPGQFVDLVVAVRIGLEDDPSVEVEIGLEGGKVGGGEGVD